MRLRRARGIEWPQIHIWMWIASIGIFWVLPFLLVGLWLGVLNLFISVLAISSVTISRALLPLIWVKLFRDGEHSAAGSGQVTQVDETDV